MNVKDVKVKANKIYENNQQSYWILGIFCGLLMGGCLALSLFSNILLIIIIPFLVVPIFFAGHVAFIAIQQNEKITFLKALSYFVLYFKAPFNSSFSFMKAFFKTLLIFIISIFVFSIASFSIVNAISPQRMADFIQNFNNLVNNPNFTIQDLNNLTIDFKDVVLPFTFTAIVPCFALAMSGYIYFISQYSLNVYFRLACPIRDPLILTVVSKVVGSKNKKNFLHDYFYLVWPLYLIVAVGFAGGIIGAVFMDKDAVFASIFACSTGLASFALFLPFYFPRMQCLYESYAPLYQEALILSTTPSKTINSLKEDNNKKSEIVDIDIHKEDDSDN